MEEVTASSRARKQHDRAPARVGRYRIVGELGRGGMAAVYRAVEQGSERQLALKRLENAHESAGVLFEREYHTLASISHPSVIEVYDFGIDQRGRRFYTMELLEGEDLASLSPLAWPRVCEHLRDIAASLSLLHARKLLHRDVSPRNVRVCMDGHAKLIDFGALTSFGLPAEVLGTPMCIAPEALRRDELDQRSDLFALGVVAYYALTREKPYPATRLRDADRRYDPPRPPSAFVRDVPEGLDQLVLALLSPDPGARPSSAAEVVERLSAIAQLEEPPLDELAASHLLSTALCGREREKGQLAQHLGRALRGEGGLVVLEASAGMGRSRLAAETMVDARLHGFTTVRVGALAHPEPHGVLLAAMRALQALAPDDARETLAPHLPVLASAFPEVLASGRTSDRPPPRRGAHADALGSAEQRARVQDAFGQWMLAMAGRRPLLLAVDDVHLCDSMSAGALAALAHSLRFARLLLVVTQELGAPAPVAVQQLARTGARIRLRGLPIPALQALVTSALGEGPFRTRLTQWLYSAAQGNPAQSLELLASLIERGIVRYAGGGWSLPAELRDEDLPSSLQEALGERIAALSESALELARVFAVHQGDLSLSLCGQLLPNVGRAELFSALNELLTRQVVSVAGNSYRLRQAALRPLLIEGLSPERVQGLHHQLASALLVAHDVERDADLDRCLAEAPPDVLGAALQAGWHFLYAGDEASGRELLRAAGIELTHRGDGLAEAVPALEAALAAFESLGRKRFEVAYLMVPLTLAGTYSDFRINYRYGDELLELLGDLTGITLAGRWSRVLGRRLSLALALPVAFVRRFTTRRRLSTRTHREAFLGLISIASAVVGCSVPLLDYERCERVMRQLAPLEVFRRSHPARLVRDFLAAMTHAAAGRYGSARERGRQVMARLRAPGGVKGLPESARIQLEVGLHIMLGSVDANRTDESIQETIDALEGLHTSVSRQCLAGVRAAYHAARGEREGCERWQQEVDVLAAQAGSTWRQDVILARNDWWLHALCEDVMGLKHAMRRLEVIAADAPTLAATRDAASACYLAERGRHAEALARFASVFESAVAEPTALGMRLVGAYARILRGAGEAERAREVCERALAELSPLEEDFTVLTLGARVEHALALADLGRAPEAATLLDTMVEQQRSHDNPMLRALAHRARATVAIVMADRVAVHAQLTEMSEHCRRSGNPALIAQARALEDRARQAGLVAGHRYVSLRPDDATVRDVGEVREAFARCRGPSERFQVALDALVAKAGAERGFLYLSEPEGLRFAAPLAGIEPPDSLREELERELLALDDDLETRQVEIDPITMKTVIESEQQPDLAMHCSGQAYRSVLLTTLQGYRLVAVGAIALAVTDEPLTPVPHAFVDEIARGLFDAGDIHTVFLGRDPERR